MNRAYVFVDGENHFVRSNRAAATVFGADDAARRLTGFNATIPGTMGFPESLGGYRFGWHADFHFFWDCHTLSRDGFFGHMGHIISRAIYVTACAGDDDKQHEAKEYLHQCGFEPVVISEPKGLEVQRLATLNDTGVMEKPKGCDIALATRMVSDASADLYDGCCLFTSDADFLPAIEAVRRMGKVVWVFGYKEALSKRSPYLYVPDRFFDLGQVLENILETHPTVAEKIRSTEPDSAK